MGATKVLKLVGLQEMEDTSPPVGAYIAPLVGPMTYCVPSLSTADVARWALPTVKFTTRPLGSVLQRRTLPWFGRSLYYLQRGLQWARARLEIPSGSGFPKCWPVSYHANGV